MGITSFSRQIVLRIFVVLASLIGLAFTAVDIQAILNAHSQSLINRPLMNRPDGDDTFRSGWPKPGTPTPTATITTTTTPAKIGDVLDLFLNRTPKPTSTPAPTKTPTITPTITQTPPPTSTPTATATITPLAVAGAIRISSADGMKLLYVPPGEFTMGLNDVKSDENPAHKVYLDGFWVDKTLVTNTQYNRCVQAGICVEPVHNDRYNLNYGKSGYEDHPAVFVTWYDAAAYCKWVGRRLPSEAEWEKAARGTDQRKYPWGGTLPKKNQVNYLNEIGDTTAVDSFPAGASPYGALDMAGNVRQWVADWYSEDYYPKSPYSNPQGPTNGEYKVLRGGSYLDPLTHVRTTDRLFHDPKSPGINRGFRCVVGE
jgi:formylglycine-generating enzyme required for sulfatase activity